MSTLDTPLERVVGKVGTTLTKKRKGMQTAGDLLDFLPRRYLDARRPSRFADLRRGDEVVIVGRIRTVGSRPMKARRGWLTTVDLHDEAGDVVQLTFFSKHSRVPAGRLTAGSMLLASGTVDDYRGAVQLVHPEYVALEEGSAPEDIVRGHLRAARDGEQLRTRRYEGLIPVYTRTAGVAPHQVSDAVQMVLTGLDLQDAVPATVRQRRQLPELTAAYRLVHLPREDPDWELGRFALKYQEAFVIQAALALRRQAYEALPGIPRAGSVDGLADRFAASLPFELTAGQRAALAAIEEDLGRPVPMNRLLQGEVGSGKTVVALLAMLRVVDSGAQTALLAPTEVLATQHHLSITRLLGDLAGAGTLGADPDATDVVLLTGSTPAKERREVLARTADGTAGIVIGTHALLEEGVEFADLGLVVVDEQHRFGVEQRDVLRAKSQAPPHVLTMTATPIPRTVAMTVYGDMEVTTLRELPPGRSPIETFVVPGEREPWVARMWTRIAEEVRAGRQAYVVCSRIGDGSDSKAGPARHGDADLPTGTTAGPGGPLQPGEDGLPSTYGAVGVHEALLGLAVFRDADIRVGLLHGRMTGEEKRAAMDRFASGEIQVLVATTVIEVGVDVPGATVMLVMDADRFGISQLHQLRGRVGRGSLPGLCLLHTQTDTEADPQTLPIAGGYDTRETAPPASTTRLHAVASTTDGFTLARVDLEQRREGDVLGSSQSGRRSGVKFLRLLRDEDLIEQAREDARAVVRADPALRENPGIRDALERLGEETADFLEKA